ncbi:hypothetical protein ACFYPC_18255 [Streptomyces sp. NPDC005808]|uniref:hypothetical protein n=1 Tax=Streptomyces sp. NPDC005808 TaxID=3364734 RepID=UPI00369544AA
MRDSTWNALAFAALAAATLTMAAYVVVALRMRMRRTPDSEEILLPQFTIISILTSLCGFLAGKLIAGTTTDTGFSDLETLWVPILAGAAATTLLQLNPRTGTEGSNRPRVIAGAFSFAVGLALAANGGLVP